jgi:hypothetical protein
MRRVALIAAAAVVTGLIVGVVLAGGNGDSSNKDVTAPELTVPGSAGTTDNTQTDKRRNEGTTGDSGQETGGSTGETPQAPTGGAQPQAPSQTGGQPDTPQSDTPPPKGSPAERFEHFCAQNPGACER